MLSGQQDLSSVPFVSAKEADAFSSAGIGTVEALLSHFPKRHEDRRRFDGFPLHATETPVCLRGILADTSSRAFGPGRRMFEATLTSREPVALEAGRLTCRWFNMPYLGRVLAAGMEIVAYGRVKDVKGRLFIDHPEFEVLPEDAGEGTSVHLERIVPVYRNVAGITQRRLRECIHRMLAESADGSFVWDAPRGDGVSKRNAYRMVHFPEPGEDPREAMRRFALDEFFRIQLSVVWRKHHHARRNGRVRGRRTDLLTRFYQSLPFDFTEAQKRAVREIVADMRSASPMNRLLQGDVGSGKTFVAMSSMLLAVDSGAQAALMAPTQILAEQHYLTFRRWLEPIGVRIALRTGNRDETSHLEIEGGPQIVIGTHALLHSGGTFDDLGLVVIDEQHKFGVSQRAALIGRGKVPDVLVMTATPIPRTLTMTLYGDLDVSLLDEKPGGRGTVVTALRINPKQTDVNRFVKDQLQAGRQAYLVYPLVEESEGIKAESASEAFGKWRKRLAGFEVGLIHGKLAPEEKEEVMRRFREREIAALVATTVIEVGVDVPNASVMLLHHAERFGLAQIHQLRGLIGRGAHKGYCILLSDGRNPEGLEKLRVIEGSGDGFEIAEADLRMRGPGDVLGTRQSGLGELKFGAFLGETALLLEARGLAERVVEEDPELKGPHRRLRDLAGGEGGGFESV